jgi:hypothetical protein
MSIERVHKTWFRNRTARVREIRTIRGFHLLALESRIALSAALADVPASPAGDVGSFVADVQGSPAEDGTAQAIERDADQRLIVDTSAATLPGAPAQPTGASMGVDPNGGSMTPLGNGTPDFQVLGATDQTDSSPQSPSRESDGGADTPPQGPSEPELPVTPDPTVRIAQTDVAEDKFDPGLLDPLAWTDSEDQFSDVFLGETDVEDPLDYTVGLSLLGLSAQQEIADGIGIGCYPDYLAAGAWRSFSFEPSILSQRELESLRDMQTVDAQNESIMAGTMPSRSLLSGLNLPDQAPSDAHQRFAELGPLEQSSPLALVATLWTMPSFTPSSPDPRSQPAERGDRHPDSATPLASWNVYVMGLDHAFERSYRDICQGLTAGARTTSLSESSHRELEGWSEWRMPVVPMARVETLGGCREALRTDGRSQSDHVIIAPEADFIGPSAAASDLNSPSCSQRDPQHPAAAGRAIPAAVPIVSVIAGGALIAGWFWTRRAIWQRHGEARFISPLRSRAWRVLP